MPHIAIMITVALILIGIYLYFTMSDVKKLALEIVHLKNTNKTLATSLTTLAKEFQFMKEGFLMGEGEEELDEEGEEPEEAEPEEVLQLLNAVDGTTIETVDETAETAAEDTVEGPAGTAESGAMTEEKVKAMKYEDLKKYCQQHHLSYKGNKNELVERILKYVEL